MSCQFYKNMALWVVILLMLLMLVTMLRQNQPPDFGTTPYSEFISRVDAGQIESVLIDGTYITGRMKNSAWFSTYAPAITDGLLNQLMEKKVEVTAKRQGESPFWQLLTYWFPFLLFVGLWIFFVRDMRSRR
jgi:cell division protease FtsH